MRKSEENTYFCPDSSTPLKLRVTQEEDAKILEGELVSERGHVFPIRNGVPDLTFPFELLTSDAQTKDMYDVVADVYDQHLHLTFNTFDVDEIEARSEMVDSLNLKPHYKVLEIGAGTGRDSELIAKRLGPEGKFYVQDISYNILEKSFKRLEKFDVPIEYHLSNASYLPFEDNFFDAVYHFGSLNTFSEQKRALEEINRVTKVGGRVIVGDESMPPWWRETEYGKVLMNSNHHYQYEIPYHALPVSVRDVRLRWIIGGVFYVFDYTVGDGEPQADLDFEIPGARGGTHRTRFYGQLEGVTPEAKKMVQLVQQKTGKSMHAWLDETIKKEASKVLELDE